MLQLDTRVPALLLRLDRNPFHHGSLGAIRSLGRAGVEVHAFVEAAGVPLARSRYLRHGHRFPGDAGSAADVERALLAAAARIGRPAVLIPMDDAGAITAARLAARLRGPFLLPDQPDGLVERAADKAALAALCAELSLPHPPTVVPEGPAQAAAAARALGLPVIAKWSRPWLLPPGGPLRSTTLVTTADQAGRLYEQTPRAGSRLLLQRLVPGGPGADWFFHGCFGAGGTCLLGGTGRKDVSWPAGSGLTAVGRRLPNPEVTRSALLLAERLAYRGVLDLDFRRDAATGAYHLLDFNPRPGAQFRLLTDAEGLDVVRALHLDLTGRAVAASPPSAPRVFVAENYRLLAALTRARGGPPRPRFPADPPLDGDGGGTGGANDSGGGRSRGPGREVEWAWFAADDPRPFLAMARGCLRRARELRGGGGAGGAGGTEHARTDRPPEGRPERRRRMTRDA
ncbi:ATP-grasp domain-containing protein [Streptomyces sp. DSM 44917]|uniref:ATP-grasp domain-containing protein n=1 Tax=Streptomyces boetiae TaxID=3075541 RepID=A0ABU2L6Z2_9ACTN|nr:ATP-grasp domain-containing protein [Streptomyces sp. DSM 44917]MDT0307087.1 ATP-grasp domain-containing protein [Streptomyces sp. DSM 44917]